MSDPLIEPAEDPPHLVFPWATPEELPEHFSTIEQAKGMLMVVYRFGADAAFDLLTWLSQAGDVALHAVAEQIISDFLEVAYRDVLPPRSTYDQLLLTVHERITGNA